MWDAAVGAPHRRWLKGWYWSSRVKVFRYRAKVFRSRLEGSLRRWVEATLAATEEERLAAPGVVDDQGSGVNAADREPRV
jgi:hypothetical protein